MTDDKDRRGIVDTSDCLEAVDVFRGWKNFLFVIVLASLLLLQAAFWLVDIGYVTIDESAIASAAATAEKAAPAVTPALQPVADPNKPAEPVIVTAPAKPQSKSLPNIHITFKQLSWAIKFLNFLVIPTAVLYCLTLLFGLKVSLVGRLGGISHVTRAFFLSLLAVTLMLPWQKVFWGVVVGAMYSPEDLLNSVTITPANDTLASVLYYARFTVYWAVVVLLLIFAQIKTSKWAKAMLRRLEVM